MDLQIQFYDNTKEEISSRYLDSRFVNQPNAVNLCNNMTYSTRNLNPAKTLIGIPTKMNGDPLHEAGMLACEWEIHKIIKQLSSK